MAVRLNHQGVRELLRSPQILEGLRGIGEQIAQAAGPGHEVEAEIGPNRARVEVRTATFEAMVAEERHRNLTRAVDAGRV